MEAKDHFRVQRIDGVDHFLLTPPNIKALCEPLMGSSVREDDRRRLKELPLEERIRIYKKALKAIERWEIRDGLLNLALYRRQVTVDTPIDADETFLALACALQPVLSIHEWADIAQRMPKGTPIHDACRWYAGKEDMPVPAAYAAE